MQHCLAAAPIEPAFQPGSPDSDPFASGRYRLGERVDVRGGVEWFDGIRLEGNDDLRVRIGREPVHLAGSSPAWPGLSWEAAIRDRARHLGLPRVLERFRSGEHHFLVLEEPAGTTLWDAWDDTTVAPPERFGWLIQLADVIRALHASGAMLECLRPNQVRITPLGQVVLTPDAVLLPLPIPRGCRVHSTHDSAPELRFGGSVDARADLYHFGATLMALHLGRELTDLDFDRAGSPRSVLEREPDIHPCLGRLLAKTFTADLDSRFSAGAGCDDPSGFAELRRTLEQAQHVLGWARLDVAAWSSTGMVRGNNEDAIAVVQSADAGDHGVDNCAWIALADGMGGNAAGEVAAALAVQSIRRNLMRSPPFCGMMEEPTPAPVLSERTDVADRVTAALRNANRAVYMAGRGEGRRGMGCTAEAIFVDGRQAVVGHVGDSRTYLLHRGEMRQLTRDQTVVGRLIEQGFMSLAEATAHPRRGELTQAIGGRADVVPEIIRTPFGRGDWLIICTDGLTARLTPEMIRAIVEPATSADSAARRLVNRANLEGSGDNVSVVIVRGC